MTTAWFKPVSAALFLLLVCLNPASALAAAGESLNAWALSVVPALLPFLIAVPALTCPDVCALLARASSPFLRLMRLPENSTGALLIGLLSGSPAGAAVLSSVPRNQADPPGAFLRAALMASGSSPAFLLTGVAASMLDSPETGWLLIRSQLLAVLLSGLILRQTGHETAVSPSPRSAPSHGAVLSAAQTLLTIGGYMALFSILACQLSLFISPVLQTPLLAIMELAGGCRALTALPYPPNLLLPLISAVACFGGISVCAQCLSFLTPIGVSAVEYISGKLIQAALAGLITLLQLELPAHLPAPQFCSLAALVILLISLLASLLFRRRKKTNTLSAS